MITLRLNKGSSSRVLRGHPWIYSNELTRGGAGDIAAGTLVRILTADGRPVGVATYNPHSLIAARLLDRNPDALIDPDWIAARLRRALHLRTRLIGSKFYRLIHAEADGLPGAIIDRFADVVVVQANSAGMDALAPELVAALEQVLQPETILIAGDDRARSLEGLPPRHDVVKGSLPDTLTVEENGRTYLADLTHGQKTGWFFDHRANRAFIAGLARDRSVLDVYTYAGGFALAAAAAGARQVTAIDRAAPALALAEKAAEGMGTAGRCSFVQGEAFAELERRATDGERFEIVVADPPARAIASSPAFAPTSPRKTAFSPSPAAAIMCRPVTSPQRQRAASGTRDGRRASSTVPAPMPTIRCIPCCRKAPISNSWSTLWIEPR